jgi:hypothetical protein
MDHHLRQVLQIDLMHDAHPRRHNPEVGKGLLCPLEELIPLAILLILSLNIALKRQDRPKRVYLHGVIYD